MLFASCKPDEELGDLIPLDEDPAITVTAPANTRLLRRAGESVTVSFRLADKEALKLFRAVPRIFDASNTPVGDALPIDIEVSGQNIPFDFTLTVPALDPYFRIRYTCYVLDTKGAWASTEFWVTILPDPAAPEPYKVLSYQQDTIFNLRSGTRYAFNFTARTRLPALPGQNLDTLRLQMDIAELSGSQGLWLPRLHSPSNNVLGLDSVFVITNAEKFNYEEATYTTIFQAFFSDPAPALNTPVLKVGDYVIVRLIKSPRPQFAVMRITSLKDDGAGLNIRDEIRFDYKVTTP